jgi:DNA-binding beta-propeller fold protein YncE
MYQYPQTPGSRAAASPATGGAPFSITVDPKGRFAYVANLDSRNVSAYRLNASTGALAPAVTPTIPTGNRPASVAVEASGKFAYVADNTDNNVSIYTIDAVSGVLNPQAGLTVAAGLSPNRIVLSR